MPLWSNVPRCWLATAQIGMRFGAPVEAVVAEKKVREKKPRRKNDPKLIAAARELRDRWLEHVNSGEFLLEGAGKYDVTRALPVRAGRGQSPRLLSDGPTDRAA